MDTLWLEDFLCVVVEGGFSRAAARRNVTQPAFSRRIRALERWVGADLFDRATHKVALTEAGERFRTTAEDALRVLREGCEEAQAAARAGAEAIRFVSTHTLAVTAFPRLLAEAGPEATSAVVLTADHMAACERLMRDGHAQFLLCHHHDAAPSTLPANRFRTLSIGTDTLLPVAAPLYAEIPKPRPSLAFTLDAGMGQILAAVWGRTGRRPRGPPVFTSHLASILAAMAREGRGVAWAPLSLVASDLAAERLIELVDEDQRVEIGIVVMRPLARQSAAAEAFWRRLEAAAKVHGFELTFDHFDFASADYYETHGRMMPEDWKQRIGGHDAIFFGAVGWPEKVPDHISLWGSLVPMRREFDQYVNLRPVRLMPGVRSPLAARHHGSIDFMVVRENTEGEYSSVGGRMFEGTEREFVVQDTIMTRVGVDRVLRYAFDLAQTREKKHLTSATKSNGISISMPYWDERVVAVGKGFPDVRHDKLHIDNMCAQFVLNPDRFDVVVASNLFGDILSDLGPACTGTIGIAPAANIDPERRFPSLFEPVHGSAPDIAGQGIANPIGQIWAGSMMLDHLGEHEAAKAVLAAIEKVLGNEATRTRDLQGKASTEACGTAVAEAVQP